MAYTYAGYKWNGDPFGSAGGNVTWSMDGTVPASFENDLQKAFAWSDYGNITFTEVASNSASNITFTYGAIDGPGNVAGRADTSFDPSSHAIASVSIIIDNAEGWTEDANGVATSSFSNVRLSTVALHEVGHGIGLDHDTTTGSIMSPVANPNINTLQADDIQGVRAIYGAAACFASGTLIRTLRGEVAVECLAVGDVIVTARGDERPIRWLGRMTVDLRNHPDPRTVVPIRIARDAVAANRPARDLFVSPGHAIAVTCLDEVLIPAHVLVNGSTIVPVPADDVTYWHVELDGHDVLLAEGLPAETYLDCGNRASFDGADALPDGKPASTADYCRPFVDGGPILAAIRERLAARASALGWTATHDMDPHLLVDGARVEGDVADGIMRFLLPAAARDVVLVSETFSPADRGEWDDRRLGFALTGLQVSDGLAVDRSIAIDDPALADGFHPCETAGGPPWRWTTGRLPLPSSLWAGCRTHVFLRIAFNPIPATRWIAPTATDEAFAPVEQTNVIAFRAA